MKKATEQKKIEVVVRRKELTGTIVSDKMKDTVVVAVERYIKHPKYQKFMKLRKRFKAHDAGNKHKMGEKVTIRETRPISKDKHFEVISPVVAA